MTLPDLLRNEDYLLAEPAFRVLAWVDASFSDPRMGEAGARCFEAFLKQAGAEVETLRITAKGHRSAKPSAEAVAKALDWARTAEKRFPDALFANGGKDNPFGTWSVPQFRISQEPGMVAIDIAVRPDQEKAVALADRIVEILRDLPVMGAVMGMGFHRPYGLDSLQNCMPLGFRRYRTALEGDVGSVRDTFAPTKNPIFHRTFPDFQTGLPDIGWRTIVGTMFLDRIEGEPAHEDVVVEQASCGLIVTAGPDPIWGDVNAAEDISAFQAVSAWLKPLRIHRGYAYRAFGGERDPVIRDRIDAYLDRLDPPDLEEAGAGGVFGMAPSFPSGTEEIR